MKISPSGLPVGESAGQGDGRSRPRRRVFAAALAAVTLAGVTAACGSSSPSTSSSSAAPSTASTGSSTNLLTDQGSGRQAKLVAEAKKEGAVRWYTSLAGPSVAAIAKAFEKQYPYIKVSTTRAAENTIASKIAQEAQAGQPTADVVEIPASTEDVLQAEGLLQQYWTPNVAQIPSALKTAGSNGDVWAAADRISPVGFGYNTNLLPASAVPKTLNDLLNPALKGKMAIGVSTGVLWVGVVLHELGNTAGQAFLKKLGSTQAVKPESISAAAVMGLIAQGQLTASPAVYHDHALLYKSKGDPVEWLPTGTVLLNDGRVSITKPGKDPAAAELFAQFLLSSAGQKVLTSYNYTSPLAKITYKYWLPEQTYKTAQSYSTAFNNWTKIFKADFGS